MPGIVHQETAAERARRKRREALARGATDLVPRAEPLQGPSFAEQALRTLSRLPGMAAAGIAKAPVTVPWGVVGGVAAPVQAVGSLFNIKGPDVAGYAQGQAQGWADAVDRTLHTDAPENIVEEVVQGVPSAVVPGKQVVVLTALNELLMLAGPRISGAIEELDTLSGEQSEGAAPWGFINSAQAATKPKKKMEWSVDPITGQVTEDGVVTLASLGGPIKARQSEVNMLGGLVLLSAGAMLGPTVIAAARSGTMARARPVMNAVPGTTTNMTYTDLLRTMTDDANAGIMNSARRSGVDPITLQALEDVFQGQTRAQAGALAEAVVNLGKINTVSGLKLHVPAPIAALSKVETPETNAYMHLLDTWDALQAQVRPRAGAKTRRVAGPSIIRGLDEAETLRRINQMEAANPQLKEFARAYRLNVDAMRVFARTGEYATLSGKKYSELSRYFKNEVPWPDRMAAVIEDATFDRGSATANLATKMRDQVRARLENEARGQFVDSVRRVDPSRFKPLGYTNAAGKYISGRKHLKDNAHYTPNVVRLMRKGKEELYTTDPTTAAILKLDPYYHQTMGDSILYIPKRMLEANTTGSFAPWFAVTAAQRAYRQAKEMYPSALGSRLTSGITGKAAPTFVSPTILGSWAAIPEQLVPQLAGTIAGSLERGSGQWLNKSFGAGTTNALALRLSRLYHDSYVAKLDEAGGFRGSILQHQVEQANNAFDKAFKTVKGPLAAVGRGYMALLQAGHNAAAHNFAKRGMKRGATAAEAALEARRMTGNTRVGGQTYTRSGDVIPFQEYNKVKGAATRGVGRVAEFGREGVPWFNVIVQSTKKVGQTYLKNPVAFTGRMWLYSIMPAFTGYFYNRALGTDPEGNSYSDHNMNRGMYSRAMESYIGVPGKPVAEGILMPRYQEESMAMMMAEMIADHLTHSAKHSEMDDFLAAAGAFAGVTIVPSPPPLVNWAMASQGMQMPSNAFTGEAYRTETAPFDQLNGLPSSLETMARSMAPGIADIVGASAAAFSQTPESFSKALVNGITEGAKRGVVKTPGLRDVLNVHNPVSGDDQTSQMYFHKSKAIDKLVDYVGAWGRGDEVDRGSIATVTNSPIGEAIATAEVGEASPTSNPGVDQPLPTNPLYKMFIVDLYNRFEKDKPSQGGRGFQALLARMGDATAKIKRLKAGANYVTWRMQMETEPAEVAYLEKNKVDWKHPGAARNFYERQRKLIRSVLLRHIEDVEAEFSQRLGWPVKIEDLDPYKSGPVDAWGMTQSIERGPVGDRSYTP